MHRLINKIPSQPKIFPYFIAHFEYIKFWTHRAMDAQYHFWILSTVGLHFQISAVFLSRQTINNSHVLRQPSHVMKQYFKLMLLPATATARGRLIWHDPMHCYIQHTEK
jgi:hypothetical protein